MRRDSDFAYFGIVTVEVWALGTSSAGLVTFRIAWCWLVLGLGVWYGFGFGCVSLVALTVRVGFPLFGVLGIVVWLLFGFGCVCSLRVGLV